MLLEKLVELSPRQALPRPTRRPQALPFVPFAPCEFKYGNLQTLLKGRDQRLVYDMLR